MKNPATGRFLWHMRVVRKEYDNGSGWKYKVKYDATEEEYQDWVPEENLKEG